MQTRLTKRWALAALLAAAVSVEAHQPTPPELSMECLLSRRGDTFLRLRNNTRQSQTLTLRPGVASSAGFNTTQPVVISPNAMLDINIGVL